MPIPNQDGTVTVMLRALQPRGGELQLWALFPCEPYDHNGKGYKAMSDGRKAPFPISRYAASRPCTKQEVKLLTDCLRSAEGIMKIRVVSRITADMQETFNSRRMWLELGALRQSRAA